MNAMNVHYGVLETPIGPLWVGATLDSVVAVEFYDEPRPLSDVPLMQRALAQLREYFDGQRRDFDLPLGARGTAFQQQVWHALCAIPYGRTASYRHIANAIGNPKAVRAVGAANGRNPLAIVVPCHRIIGADGSLTGYAGGLARKQWLLAHEGAAQGSLW